MHPVARVSTSICRNLHTQQMSVLVLLCTSYTTCFGPYWWPSSGGLQYKKFEGEGSVAQMFTCHMIVFTAAAFVVYVSKMFHPSVHCVT
jgi:hypothetical protein